MRVDALLARTLLFVAVATNQSIAYGAAEAGPALKPFAASYAWSWHGMTVAVSNLKLEQQGANWVYSSKSSPRGIGRVLAERPVQKSTLRVTEQGVEPLSYVADDGTPSTKRDANVQFDWEHNRVTGVYEDAKVDMPLRKGIQDDLSVQIALMVELLAGREPEQFQMIDKNSVREYQYTREQEESLSTAVGTIDTIVYRAQKKGSPRVTRFWCAPSRGYIPMRVEQKKGDDVQWSLQVQSVTRD